MNKITPDQALNFLDDVLSRVTLVGNVGLSRVEQANICESIKLLRQAIAPAEPASVPDNVLVVPK